MTSTRTALTSLPNPFHMYEWSLWGLLHISCVGVCDEHHAINHGDEVVRFVNYQTNSKVFVLVFVICSSVTLYMPASRRLPNTFICIDDYFDTCHPCDLSISMPTMSSTVLRGVSDWSIVVVHPYVFAYNTMTLLMTAYRRLTNYFHVCGWPL